jgi:magnesium transporter
LPRALGRLIEGINPRPRAAAARRSAGNPDAVVDCASTRPAPGGPARCTTPRPPGRPSGTGARSSGSGCTSRTGPRCADRRGVRPARAHRRAGRPGGHRPAAETIGDVTRLVLRTARYVEHEELTATSEVVDTGDVTVLIGPWFVITVRHGAPARSGRCARTSRSGPPAAARAVGGGVRGVQPDGRPLPGRRRPGRARPGAARGGAFSPTQRSPEIAALLPAQAGDGGVQAGGAAAAGAAARLLDRRVPEGLRPYFVDVRGRLARAVDRVAGFDDLLNSILQARLAQVSVDQNNDMRKIAAWAGDRGGADGHRRHLRHELRAHAGAGLEVRYGYTSPNSHGLHSGR